MHPSIRVAHRKFVLQVPLAVLGSLALTILPGVALGNPTFTQTCFSDNLTPAMAAGDFNNDGNLDIAIEPGGQSIPFFLVHTLIDVYLGNGDGTFSGPNQYDTGSVYGDMAAADLDNDGNLDLVTSQLAVLKGNGDGTFQTAQTYPGGAFAGVAAADFNEDGYFDVVTTDEKKAVSVALNWGNGTFKAPVSYRTGDYNRAVLTGDFTGDGHVDVATFTQGTIQVGVTILPGKGDGKFRSPINTNLPTSVFAGRDIAAADFDGNGTLDLALPLQGGAGVMALLGNGNGTFGPQSSYPMAGNTLHVTTGDIDGDGNQDIVAGNYLANWPPNPGGNVSVLYGDGSGALAIGNVIPVAFGHGVLVGDFNGDARADIAADACVLLNDGPVAAAAAGRLPNLVRPATGVLEARVSPNPIHDRGTFSFSLPKAGMVSVRLYDVRGRQVRSVMDRAWLPAGPHAVSFERGNSGLNAGVYFYRVESDAGVVSGRMVLMNR